MELKNSYDKLRKAVHEVLNKLEEETITEDVEGGISEIEDKLMERMTLRKNRSKIVDHEKED